MWSPVGSNGRSTEHAELATDLTGEGGAKRPKQRHAKRAKRPRKMDDEAAPNAAIAFDKGQR